MKNRSWFTISTLAISVVLVADSLQAQRGGRGRRRSEAVTSRLGAWFVTAELPAADQFKDAKARLAACKFLEESVAKEQLSVLYLYDPTGDDVKHKRFEETMFNSDTVVLSFKSFRLGRIDVTKDDQAMERYGKLAPLFVVFDEKGKRVGEASMRGYRAATKPLVKLLNSAAAGHVKPSLATFVKKYREFINGIEVNESRTKTINDQRSRLARKGKPDRVKEAQLDKDEKQLRKEMEDLLELEKKLLADAKAPPRPDGAVRVGEKERRGRR